MKKKTEDKQIALANQIINYLIGEYDGTDIDTQIAAGWFDWFCQDRSLPAKTQALYKKVYSIIKTKKFNPFKTYVFFKNNCPMNGGLYDDFRICLLDEFDDDDDGRPLYTVCPRSGHASANGKGEVWGRENDFKEPIFEGSWKEIKEWFLK